LLVYDILNPASPYKLAEVQTRLTIGQIIGISNHTLYLLTYYPATVGPQSIAYEFIEAVDIANPAGPNYSGAIRLAEPIEILAFQNNRLFYSTGQLRLMDMNKADFKKDLVVKIY
jgi:hypothetical protein